MAWLPAQLIFNFGKINGITIIMARPIADKSDQVLIRFSIGPGLDIIHDSADVRNHIDIFDFVAAADIV